MFEVWTLNVSNFQCELWIFIIQWINDEIWKWICNDNVHVWYYGSLDHDVSCESCDCDMLQFYFWNLFCFDHTVVSGIPYSIQAGVACQNAFSIAWKMDGVK